MATTKAKPKAEAPEMKIANVHPGYVAPRQAPEPGDPAFEDHRAAIEARAKREKR